MTRRVTVDRFDALLGRRLTRDVNAVAWPRALPGDFAEVAHALAPEEGLVVITADDLAALALSDAGRLAADVMCADLRRLEAHGKEPVLNCIAGYPRDDSDSPVATDVMSFHVDRAPVEVETYLCTYFGAPSEGLDNEDGVLRRSDPDVHTALVAAWRAERGHTLPEGPDDFAAFLAEHSYDLHYRPLDGARPWSFGVGALWKIAVQWPGCPAPPCIHRAPDSAAPRLLLIC